jgi:mannose-6-phosphate isomerase
LSGGRATRHARNTNGTLAEILRKVSVKAGDTVYVPSGMVHAIGPGVTVFETQQASDLTYRLFDWNRAGLDGKPRELNVAKAADVLDYRAGGQSTLVQIDYHFEGLERTALIADRRFTVERIVATAEPASLATDGRPLIIMSLEHAMKVGCCGSTASLQKFQTVLIPAAADCCTIQSGGESAPLLFVTPAKSRDQLATRLIASGIAQSQIDVFNAQFSSSIGCEAHKRQLQCEPDVQRKR